MAQNKRYNQNRKRLISKYAGVYFPFKPKGVWYENACVYCGNRSQELDHIPPMAWLDALGTNYFYQRGMLIVKVPSCKECNRELGDKRLFTIKDRTSYLLGRYLKKYDLFMRGIVWDDDEIEELTGVLKGEISRFADHQRAIDYRIGILEENLSVR